MLRPQFKLNTVFWLMLMAAAYCAGVVNERRFRQQRIDAAVDAAYTDAISLPYPDAERWEELTRRQSLSQPRASTARNEK